MSHTRATPSGSLKTVELKQGGVLSAGEEGGKMRGGGEGEMGDKWKDPMEVTHKWGPVHCSHTPAS